MEVECGSNITIEGSENISQYQSSKRSVRAFCQVCGTHLYMKPIDKEEYGIPPGLFENDEGIHFNRQVFFDQKPEYYTFSNTTKNISSETIYEHYPEVREENTQ
jgi:hypothetical protein